MRSLPLLCLLFACETNKPAGTDDTASSSPDDTAPVAGDCTPIDVTAEITDVTTVVRVTWTTEEPTAGYVEFGGENYGRYTPTTEVGTEHEVLLLGMPADTELHYRIVPDQEGCEADVDRTVMTGSLPSGLYPTRVTGTSSFHGYQVLPLQGTQYAVVIVDEWGHYVWYHLLDETEGNLMRAFLSADGETVNYMLAGPQSDLSQGTVVRVSLDGSERTEMACPNCDHDIVELPDATLTAIVVNIDNATGAAWDTLVEFAPDGSQTKVFDAADHWDPDELGIETAGNWTHGNALDYDPVEDVYYLSMKNLESLAKIDRATGEVYWTMNGRLNQFDWGDSELVQMHHQFEVIDEDSILFFENGSTDRGYSQAVEVSFDDEAMTAEEVWTYQNDPPLFVFAKGDVHRFEDGNTQVVWSSSGQIQHVTPEGDVEWQMDLDLGQSITFVHMVSSMYASQW